MRDIGVYTTVAVPTQELVALLESFSSRANQDVSRRTGEIVIGLPPTAVWVAESADVTEGYFSDEEKAALELKLGGVIRGYVNIHFTYGEAAFKMADELAQGVQKVWGGLIDYRGSGGDLGEPPRSGRE